MLLLHFRESGTQNLIIKQLLRHHFLHQTGSFHSLRDVYTCNIKIAKLAREGKVHQARKLFDGMSRRDVVSWNSMITACWKNGHFDESLELFNSMPEKNIVSYNSIIAGCVENDRVEEAYAYFSLMPERNVSSWNAMASGFLKYGEFEKALRLFEAMPRKNVISYTAIIDGYMKQGEVEKARSLFDSMPVDKNAVSWTVMISGYVENERFDEAKDLFRKMPDKNVVAVTAMITGYCKEGMMGEARALFDEIRHKDSVSYNAIISGYAQNGSGEEALKLYICMLRMGLDPDYTTSISNLVACSSLALLKEGRQNHGCIIKYGMGSYVSVCNALITMYSKCGCISESELAFRHMSTQHLVTWNTMIAAFAQHGLYDKAIAYFEQMVLNGFEPDGITFLSLLSACGHSGMISESLIWFDSMFKIYKIVPRSEHYACLIDTLGRAGELEKALTLIQQMPLEADTAVWGAILAGCRPHLNVELASLAANKVMELDRKNSGAYVMLSNIYAAAGMWREVTGVRGLMKEQGVKKEPAYSWTEIGNRVHYFLGGDISHPYIQEIHSGIKQISLQMKTTEDVSESIRFEPS